MRIALLVKRFVKFLVSASLSIPLFSDFFFLFVILFLDLTLTLLNSYLVMPFDSIGNDGKGVLFNLMGILWWLLILKMRTLDVVSYWSRGFLRVTTIMFGLRRISSKRKRMRKIRKRLFSCFPGKK